ncbi:quinone oxidoreductase family protein [Sphingomonas lycopersici]|uniref:NADP-dependent oxidoreductase n=1 Tax=Sphingomonas lycopersici TaxID=2951807 RepID=A0AA41Z8B7_9SPHN|nr:NADP-dependent oxidoreductase [Sphingomonas lycopersici]MCW6534758.1 NADP-dependent oxidoreductase [Sphingomonas lycopersici]
MMRAIAIEGFGGPERLQPTDLPQPTPGPGEVLVKVAYAGVNPADWKAREGKLSRYFEYKFPFVLGFDLSGTVAAVGAGVEGVNPGDAVFGMSKQGQGENGAYAEYCLAWPAMLAPLPPAMSAAEAAGLPVAGVTAYGGLVDAGALKAGQTVLINGGAGGVGSLAIQIARAVGARVAVTCGARNADYVRALGAERAIDYANEDVVAAVRDWTSGAGVDLVLDAVGLDTLLPRATELVKSGGRFVEIETLISAASKEQVAAAAARGVTILSNMVAVMRQPEHLAGLAAMCAAGKVRAAPTEALPLADAAEAHRRVESGQVRGKIVLEVAAQ